MMPAIGDIATVVLDRAWQSEAIYGPIIRGFDRLPDTRRLRDLFDACGGVLIVCLPPREVALANYIARKQVEYVSDDHAWHRIYNEYVVMTLAHSSTIYDYTKGMLP